MKILLVDLQIQDSDDDDYGLIIQVIWGDEESGRTWDDHALRKQELREIKMLQKQEQKQFQDLNAKELQLREQQDKRLVVFTYTPLIIYSRKGSRDISDIPPKYPYITKMT
jgi:hypothetical protein